MLVSDFGKVQSFSEAAFLKVAQILVDADEPERALWLLTSGLPAYYRDHTPAAILDARNKITLALMTTNSYKDCEADSVFCETGEKGAFLCKHTLRGQLVAKEVEAFNQKEAVPHLIDMGPGEYWLPIGLKALGLHFTYEDVGVNEVTRAKSGEVERSKWDGKSPLIFVGLEIIEHLSNTNELLIECLRITNGKMPDQVHLSTPLYTYDSASKPIDDLKRNGLPHLRAYTPREFHLEADRIFGGYDWELALSPVMSLVGRKKSATLKS